MIREIHILSIGSGLPLVSVDFTKDNQEDKIDSMLFSGALTGIRLFLKECKIGDLTDFITNDKRIEVRCDDNIVVAIVSDLDEPSHEIIDILVEDVAELFLNNYRDEMENFVGNVSIFEPFKEELNEFIRIHSKSDNSEDINSRSSSIEYNIIKSENNDSSLNSGGLDQSVNLSPLINWLKNRYDPEGIVSLNKNIISEKKENSISVDLVLEGNDRKMNIFDNWYSAKVAPRCRRNVVFAIGLNPSHGPGTIREILKEFRKLGNRKNIDQEIYYWFPAEILFIGPSIQKSTFDGLEDILKNYKGNPCIVPEYVDHMHREHTPHHKFFRCNVSGWQWKLGELSENNYPINVFPNG